MKVKISSITIGENRRSVDPEKVQMLADSIKEVGLLSPVVISQDNVLVAGRHRLEAFKLLGRDEIEITLAEPNDKLRLRLAELDENLVRNEGTQLEQDEWVAERKRIYEELYPETTHGGDRKAEISSRQNDDLKPVRFTKDTADKTGKSERTVQRQVSRAEKIPQEMRDAIRHTPVATKAGELDVLAKLAQDEPDKAKKVVAQIESGKHESIKEAKKEIEKQDEIDERTKQALEVVEKPKSYVQGNCLDVLKTLQAKSVKLLLTDPPYGTDFQSNRRTATAQADKIANDDSPENAAQLLADMLRTVDFAMQDDCRILVFTSQAHYPLFRGVIEGAGYKVGRILTWVKENHTSGDLTDFSPQTEWLINAWRGNHTIRPRISEVLNYSREKHTSHPTEKPTALLSRLIEVCTIEGELVIDPFAGTGATIEAALKLNRKALGIELSENWFNEGLIRLAPIEKAA